LQQRAPGLVDRRCPQRLRKTFEQCGRRARPERDASRREQRTQGLSLGGGGVVDLTGARLTAERSLLRISQLLGRPQQGADLLRVLAREAVREITSGNRHVFGDIPSDNCYYASWSPDGKWIAFTLRADGVWHLGMTKADGTDFKLIKKGEEDKVTLYSPCWARDGKSIFCQDMTNIYRLSLDGSVLAQWPIGKLVPNGAMSGDGRIDVSPDGNRLLLSVDMNEEYDRRDWDGPVPALWSFDISTGAVVRLTPKNLFAWDGCWLDDANVLLVSQRPGEKQAAIYRTVGKNVKRLIENARRPTVSRP
jgi:TolB protein